MLFLQAKLVNQALQQPPLQFSSQFREDKKEFLFGQFSLKRIAIFRALPGLGELLCAVPAFRSLRAAFPEAEIVLIGLRSVKPFVKRFKHYLDRFVEFPGYPGLSEVPAQLPQIPIFLQRMQQERFDLAVQMHGSGTVSNPITELLGARVNAGFFTPGQYCPEEKRFLPYLPSESEVRRYLRLLEFLGVASQGEELEFPLWEEDEQALRAIDKIGELRPGEYVCVHPGARSQERCWASDRFAAVADALFERGLQVVLTGSKQEAALTQAIASQMKAKTLNLTGCTSLGALAALLKGARLLVCNDAGVSHLAAALRVSSVVIFTRSDPNRWAPLDRDRHRIVSHATGLAAEVAIAEAVDLLQKEGTPVA